MHSPQPASPALHERYPLKLGRSVRKTASARSFVQLKFSHVGAAVDPRRAGVLTPSKQACTIALPAATDAAASVTYAGTRLRTVSDVGNYVLVFAAGAFWLERVDDVFVSARAGARGERLTVPPGGDDEFAAEPESWMHVDTGTGSPVTPDADEEEEDGARGVGAKCTPMAPAMKTVSGGRTLQPMPEMAIRRPAGKTVASKGVPPVASRAGVEEVVEEVEEVEASSSEEEGSSDESDSSDSADSAEYTDRSSDED